MKWNIVTVLLIVMTISPLEIFSQDIVPFEIIDNDNVGLTVTPYSKFGMAVGDINKAVILIVIITNLVCLLSQNSSVNIKIITNYKVNTSTCAEISRTSLLK